MQYRLTDLMMLFLPIALVASWCDCLTREKLVWHERHPVVPVSEEVQGELVNVLRRVKMIYSRDRFWEPDEFWGFSARYHAALFLHGLILMVLSFATYRCVSHRWPKMAFGLLMTALALLFAGAPLLVFLDGL